jgi:hypothetical protein
MTVAQLIKRLSKADPKALIVLSHDSEGNGFSEVTHIGAFLYRNGEIADPEERDSLEGGKPALVFWP